MMSFLSFSFDLWKIKSLKRVEFQFKVSNVESSIWIKVKIFATGNKPGFWFQMSYVNRWVNSTAGVKTSLNFHLSCGQVHLNFYLSCCQKTLGIQGNITLHCIFFTCPSDIGWKYMLVLIEILLVLGSRTSDFFTPELTCLQIPTRLYMYWCGKITPTLR